MATKKKEAALAVMESQDWPVLTTPDDAQSVSQVLGEMGVTRFDLDKIVVPAGGAVAFEVEKLEGVEYEQELEVIIAFAVANQRSFYKLSIEDGDGSQSPDCSSEDGVNGFGMIDPDDDDEEKAAHECASCPWNQFGTALTGGGKRCGEKAVLYAFNKETMIPFVIQVPATSLKPMKKYAMKLMGRGRKASGVVTKIALEKKEQPTPHAVMTFSYLGDLDEAARAKMEGVEQELRATFASAPRQESVELD